MAAVNDVSVMAVIRASRPIFHNAQDKVVFAVHATFVASGFYLNSTGAAAVNRDVVSSPSSTEEVGIDHWNDLGFKYVFVYSNPEQSPKRLLVICFFLPPTILVMTMRQDENQTSEHLLLNTSDYVENGGNDYPSQYKNFGNLVEEIKTLVGKYNNSLAIEPSTHPSSSEVGDRADEQSGLNQLAIIQYPSFVYQQSSCVYLPGTSDYVENGGNDYPSQLNFGNLVEEIKTPLVKYSNSLSIKPSTHPSSVEEVGDHADGQRGSNQLTRFQYQSFVYQQPSCVYLPCSEEVGDRAGGQSGLNQLTTIQYPSFVYQQPSLVYQQPSIQYPSFVYQQPSCVYLPGGSELFRGPGAVVWLPTAPRSLVPQFPNIGGMGSFRARGTGVLFPRYDRGGGRDNSRGRGTRNVFPRYNRRRGRDNSRGRGTRNVFPRNDRGGGRDNFCGRGTEDVPSRNDRGGGKDNFRGRGTENDPRYIRVGDRRQLLRPNNSGEQGGDAGLRGLLQDPGEPENSNAPIQEIGPEARSGESQPTELVKEKETPATRNDSDQEH